MSAATSAPWSAGVRRQPTRLVPPLLARAWADRRLGLAAALAVVATAALLSALLTPRGPITTVEALATMAMGLVVGTGAGFLAGRRRVVPLALVVFIAVFELVRLPVDGPTVDAIELGSMYGLIAAILGRGLHGLLVLAPMALGVHLGVELASRAGDRGARRSGPIGWALVALPSAGLVALAWLIAQPATTPAILGVDGRPLPGSVAELTTVRLGGHDQAVLIRGRSVDAPVLLYLAGGPGGTDIGAVRRDTGLEQDFVVVTWEQRGAGKSYSALDPTDSLTLDGMVADTIALTEHLRDRFDEERIYVVGNSWGATLGVLAVQRRPDLFHAFVGVGQMVSQRETDVLFYEDTLAWAGETGQAELVATLEALGPPPYADIRGYEPVIGHEHEWNAYPELDLDNEMPAILFVPENSLLDRLNAFRGFLDTFAVLYPQLQDIDFRRSATTLEVPVTMVLGEHEARGRAEPAEAWFAALEAPAKQRVIVPGAGHRAHVDRPAEFAALMAGIKAETYPAP